MVTVRVPSVHFRAPRFRGSHLRFQVIVIISCGGTAFFAATLQELGEALKCSLPVVVDHLQMRRHFRKKTKKARVSSD